MALQASFTGQSFFVGKNTPYGLIKGYVQKGRLVSAFAFPEYHAPFGLRKKFETTYEVMGMVELPGQICKGAMT